MQSGVSMVDARDAYLAADVMRFGGANQTELWRAFAARGLGAGASSAGADDDQPTPSFEALNDADERDDHVRRGRARRRATRTSTRTSTSGSTRRG